MQYKVVNINGCKKKIDHNSESSELWSIGFQTKVLIMYSEKDLLLLLQRYCIVNLLAGRVDTLDVEHLIL